MKLRKNMLILMTAIFIIIISYGIFSYMSIDRSGELTMDGIYFKGEEYKTINFAFTKVGKTLGKADDWSINEISEDIEHNFLEVRSFLDNFYVVKSSYNIPTDGNINVVYIDRERYNGKEFNDAINYLLYEKITDKINIKTDNIYHYAKSVYVGYEDCPVGTEYIGMVGYVNDELVYIKPTEYKYTDTVAPDEQIYCCYIIPSQYKNVFEKYPYYTKQTAEVVE